MRKTFSIVLVLAAACAAGVEERQVVVKERTFGCRTPEETQRFYQMALKGGKDDAAKYASEKRCRMFSEGDVVSVVEPLPSIIINGVRYKDDPNIYYLPMAAAR